MTGFPCHPNKNTSGGVATTEQQRYQMELHDLETENDQANVHIYGCDLDKIDMARVLPFHYDQELTETLALRLKVAEDACQNLPNEQEVSADEVIKMEEQFSKMAEYVIRLCDMQDDLDDDSSDTLSASYDSDSYFSDDEWSSEDDEDSGERVRKVYVPDDIDEELELEQSKCAGPIQQLAFWDDDESWTACNGDWKAIMKNDLKRFNHLMEQVKLTSKEAMEKKRDAQLNSLKRILTWGDVDADSALEDQ